MRLWTCVRCGRTSQYRRGFRIDGKGPGTVVCRAARACKRRAS